MVLKDKTEKPFRFKQFSIEQDKATMKVGTDGVLLGAWADVGNASKILDVGTGTGIIAIMLAQRAVDAVIHGVEIDEASWAQAFENVKNSPWASRMDVLQISIQQYAKIAALKYDLIVSNPPFFTGGTLSSNQDKSIVRHTIKLPHGDLLNSTRQLLNENGRFCVILPLIEGLRFKELAETYRFHCTKMVEVRPKKDKGIERLLLQFELNPRPILKESLLIHGNSMSEYSSEYIALTEQFYINF